MHPPTHALPWDLAPLASHLTSCPGTVSFAQVAIFLGAWLVPWRVSQAGVQACFSKPATQFLLGMGLAVTLMLPGETEELAREGQGLAPQHTPLLGPSSCQLEARDCCASAWGCLPGQLRAGQWSVGLGVSQIIALPFPGVTCDSPSALPLRSYVSVGRVVVVIRSFSPGTEKGTNGTQIRTGTMRVLGIL